MLAIDFDADFSISQFPYLERLHAHGFAVLVELAVAAARAAHGEDAHAVVLHDLVHHEPLRIHGTDATKLAVAVREEGDARGTCLLEVSSERAGIRVRHLTARLVTPVRGAASAFPAAGLVDVVRELGVDAAYVDEAAIYNLHPTLLGAALDALAPGASICRRIGRLTVHAPAGARVTLHASRTSESGDRSTFAMELVSQRGALVARLDDVELGAARHDTSALFSGLEWIAMPALASRAGAAAVAHVTLVGGPRQLGDSLVRALESRGTRCSRIEANAVTNGASAVLADDVVYLGACDVRTGREEIEPVSVAARTAAITTELLSLAMAVASTTSRLWVITNGAHVVTADAAPSPVQAAAWGLGRVFSLEHRGSFGGLVDLSLVPAAAEVEALAGELAERGADDQIALRGGARFALRLLKQDTPASRSALLVAADATYVITGGLGGLGLEVAAWLAERGAGHLVLLGRSAPSTAVNDALARIRRLGAQVQVATCDVADRDALARAFAGWKNVLPPVRGVFHAAGIATTSSLKNLDEATIARVLRAKVLGTLNLDAVTRDLALDAFVLFSSGASVWGSRDLGHYAAASAFLDGFAHQRRARGLAACSINWGMWDEVGMSSDPESRKLLGLVGLQAMPPRVAVQALGEALDRRVPQLTIAALDWSRFRRLYEAGAPRRRLLESIELPPRATCDEVEESAQRPAAVAATCPPMPLGCDEEQVRGFVCEKLAAIIGIPESDFDGDAALLTLGIDSISGLDLLTSLAARYGVRVPVSKLLEGITANDLAALVFASIQARAASAASVPASAPISAPPTESSVQLRSREKRAALHPSQVGLWFIDQLDHESPLYNVPACIRIRGVLDLAALEKTVAALVERHEALRTTFVSEDGEPVAIIAPSASIRMPLVDLAHLSPGAEREAEVARLARADARRPFDLATGPLMRCTVVRVGPGDHAVLLAFHHIVSDGWSMGIFVRETAVLYESFARGAASPLEPLPVTPSELVARSLSRHDAEAAAKQLAYWRAQLTGAPSVLDLPQAKPRPPQRSHDGALAPFALDAESAAHLRAFCKREGVTLFMLWLAAYQTVLHRRSGAKDICIGTPMAGRDQPESRGLLGLFVNTLVMRTNIEEGDTFRSLLARVRQTVVGGLANQDVPFDSVVATLAPKRNAAHTPLFQVGLAYQNAPMDRLRLGGLELAAVDVDPGVSKFDLHFTVRESQEGFVGTLEYSTDLFTAETIDGFLSELRHVVIGAASAPETLLGALPIAAPATPARIDAPSLDARATKLLASLRELLVSGALPAELESQLVAAHALAHWKARIAALPSGPALPLAPNAPNVTAVSAADVVGRVLVLDPATWSALRAQGRQRGIGASAIALAAYEEIVRAWNGDRSFSLTVHGLPLAMTGEEKDFATRASAREAARLIHREHASLDLAPLLAEIGREVVPVAFTSALEESDLAPTSEAHAVFSLHCHARELQGALSITWSTIDRIFPHGMPAAMLDAFGALLTRLAHDGAAWTARVLDVLPEEQRAARSAIRNPPQLVLPTRPAHGFFEAQAARHPGQPALRGDRDLSYGELDAMANAVARRLLANGVVQGDLVGVVMDKGYEQIVAVLGIVKAGAAYVPLDAAAPNERVTSLLGHARVTAVLTHAATEARIVFPSDLSRIVVDDAIGRAGPVQLARPITGDDLCYVIYTSGSTGQPKGVMVAHGGVANAVEWTMKRFEVGSRDCALAVTALHHDMSVWDIFGILGAGASLAVPSAHRAKDPAHWASLMRICRISLWNSVPAMLEMLVVHATESGDVIDAPLRHAFLGGDWIAVSLPARLAELVPGARVVSVGGPTETTMWNIAFEVERVLPEWKSIPYGTPITNTVYRVLDEDLRDCPDWVAGHMHCAGIGVARGYLHDEARTSEKFFVHPTTGERLYATGDKGRYWPDGTLEFLGRTDFQIKVQGHRIEPGEIESALGKHAGVRQSVVIAIGTPGNMALVAYLVAERADAAPSTSELRAHLGATLPPHMVPQHFVVLSAFPLSANGKVDRKQLPLPRAASAAPSASATRAEDPMESELVQIWEDVLGRQGIRTTDDFFALGGHSLLAVRLVARIEKAFGRRLDLAAIFRTPTIERLAAMLRDDARSPATIGRRESEASTVQFGPKTSKKPFFCVHPAGGDVFCYAALAREVAGEYRLVALRAAGLATGAPDGDVASMARRYVKAIRKEQAHGPYALGGWSMGGLVAYEIAQQLLDDGEEVSLVALIDSMVPGVDNTLREEDAEPLYFSMFVNDVLGLLGAGSDALPANFWSAAREHQLAALHAIADTSRSSLDRAQLDAMYLVFRTNVAAAWAYRPATLDAPLAVFAAGDGSQLAATRSAWRQLAENRLHVAALPGDHYSILSAGVTTLASMLLAQLRSAAGPAASYSDLEAIADEALAGVGS